MHGVVQVGNPGVVAVHRQQVLGEIIAAHRQEIHPPRQGPGLVHGGGHLHHHADGRKLTGEPLLQDFPVAATDQFERLFQLRHVADHGQHDAQVAQALVGLEHGPDLGEENLRMVQGHADTAPAQERVVFFNGEIGQRFVAANVQGAHGHRLGREGSQLAAIGLALLFLGGKAVAQQERHLGAIQAHPLRTLLQGAGHVRHQAGIDPQGHPVTVQGFTGLVPQRLEVPRQRHVLVQHLLEATLQLHRRIQVNRAVVTVYDQFPVLQPRIGEVHGAHHRGYAHGPGENGHMGISRAAHRNQARQFVPGHLPQGGGGQFLGDQNGAVGEDALFLCRLLQVSKYSRTQVFHVYRALSQVAVLHALEMAYVLYHHLAERPLGPLARLDQAGHLGADSRVVEDTQVDIEQGVVLGAQLRGEGVGNRLDIGPHAVQRLLEGAHFPATIVRLALRYGVQIRRRGDHHRGANGDAGGPRYAVDLG